MTPILDRLALRDAAMARSIAAVEQIARDSTAPRWLQIERAAIKRACRYHLATDLRGINKYFRPLPDLLDALNRRIDFRSSWERTAAIDLKGARLAVKIVMRREREEVRAMARAAE